MTASTIDNPLTDGIPYDFVSILALGAELAVGEDLGFSIMETTALLGQESEVQKNGFDFVYGQDSDEMEWNNDMYALPASNSIIFGDRGADMIFGSNGHDVLAGGLGNDYMYGDSKSDVIIGSRGHDIAVGGTGDDTIFADANEVDALVYDLTEGSTGNDEISFEDAEQGYNNRFIVVTEEDAALGASFEEVEGDTKINFWSNDDNASSITLKEVIGEAVGDVISDVVFVNSFIVGANMEGDVLEGTDGADYIIGGDGQDTINGYAGDDIIESGDGVNSLTGGEGNDTFRFKLASQNDGDLALGSHVISDFVLEQDKIQLVGDVDDFDVTFSADENGKTVIDYKLKEAVGFNGVEGGDELSITLENVSYDYLPQLSSQDLLEVALDLGVFEHIIL